MKSRSMLITAVLVAFAAIGAGGMMWAQPHATPTGRVGVVDVVKAFNESQRRKDFLEEMKGVEEKLKAENQARRKTIDDLQEIVDKINPSDPVYEQRARELMMKQVEYKNWFDMQQGMVNSSLATWSLKIYQEINEAAAAIAQKQGYDLVLYKEEFVPPRNLTADTLQEQFRQRKVLYASPEIELTDQVLDKMNKEYREKPKKQMIILPP